MTSSFFQMLVVGIYRLPFVSTLSRTRIGSSIYVACYDLYKRFLEAAGNPPIGLIKIDTQGSEHRVLAGAMKTLRRCRPNLFIELDDMALCGNDASAASLVRDIQGYGYRFFTIDRDGRERPMQA